MANEIKIVGQPEQLPMVGLCKKCDGRPRVQKSKITASYRVKCTNCGNTTLDYMSIRDSALAWNSKNKLSLAEEIKRIKEGR